MKLSSLDVVVFICKTMNLDPYASMTPGQDAVFRERWASLLSMLEAWEIPL